MHGHDAMRAVLGTFVPQKIDPILLAEMKQGLAEHREREASAKVVRRTRRTRHVERAQKEVRRPIEAIQDDIREAQARNLFEPSDALAARIEALISERDRHLDEERVAASRLRATALCALEEEVRANPDAIAEFAASGDWRQAARLLDAWGDDPYALRLVQRCQAEAGYSRFACRKFERENLVAEIAAFVENEGWRL